MNNLLIKTRKDSGFTTTSLHSRGFTLIELLVVIGILVVLLAIVLIAINPGRQFGQANDTKRRSDVNAILNAVGAYAADKKGVLPGAIIATPVDVVDICDALVNEYISALPVDPSLNNDAGIAEADCATAPDTLYTVEKDVDGRVTVTATSTEETTPDISVTR